MTNSAKIKMNEEQRQAYEDFCYSHKHCGDCPAQSVESSCVDVWLLLEALGKAGFCNAEK